MKTSDITVVFQGAFKGYTPREGPSFAEVVKQTRKVLPGAKILVSSWQGAEIPPGTIVDQLVTTPDPGPLAPLKLTDNKANNINRQIACTRAGMRAVRTPYAIKLRTDCFLEHAGFIDLFEALQRRDQRKTRIVTGAFFTLDTTVFERIPYHVSDWFQFGLTEQLQRYWEVPFMTEAAGRYYENRSHSLDANVFERRFRAEFAVEQYICSHYAKSLGYSTPTAINDTRSEVLEAYTRFLANEILVLDPWQIGLVFPKYRWTNDSQFQRINNLMHLDWLALTGQKPLDDVEPLEMEKAIRGRKRLKSVARWLFKLSAPLHGLLFEESGKGRFVRRQAMRAFRLVRGIARV